MQELKADYPRRIKPGVILLVDEVIRLSPKVTGVKVRIVECRELLVVYKSADKDVDYSAIADHIAEGSKLGIDDPIGTNWEIFTDKP